MNSRTPELSRLTLMCSDHEVAEFTWNHDRQAVTGKTHVLDAAHAPLMATDPSGNITRDRLSSWFKNRGIPDFRPDAADRLRAVGYPSAASLMASGFGASLSDQYWIRPAGSASTWRDVNCFENDFSEELGELLLPHDASSVPSLIEKIRGNADLLASSPDAALNGNLPKRWTIEGGQRFIEDEVRAIGRYRHGKLYLLLHSCREFTGRLVEIWGDSEGAVERVDVGGRFPRLPNEREVLDGR